MIRGYAGGRVHLSSKAHTIDPLPSSRPRVLVGFSDDAGHMASVLTHMKEVDGLELGVQGTCLGDGRGPLVPVFYSGLSGA